MATIALQPDACFTQAQHDRMQALLAHRHALSGDERQELEALIDAEVEATVARNAAARTPSAHPA